MDHLENDDPSYKAYRNSEAEASQSTSKTALSSQCVKVWNYLRKLAIDF